MLTDQDTSEKRKLIVTNSKEVREGYGKRSIFKSRGRREGENGG